MASIHDDNSHDGHAIDVDTSTVATKALMTPDGKCVHHPWVELRGKDAASGQVYQRDSCPECTVQYEANKEALRQRKLELNRQLQALENETTDGSVDERKESHSAHPQPYRPPLPHQQALDESSSVYSYLQRQQSPRVPHTQNRPSAPSRTLSTNSGTSAASSVSNNHHSSNGTMPYSNPYDPQYLAAAANAFHQQQLQLKHQGNSQEDSQILYKILQDKDNELKEVRQKLSEMQEKYQEKSLEAMKLQTTLDQVQEAFQKERMLIRLQAEQEVRDTMTTRQEAIFEKQLQWMENSIGNINASVSQQLSASVDGISSNGDNGEESAAENSAVTTTAAKNNLEKRHPWTATNNNIKGKPNRTSLGNENKVDEKEAQSGSGSNVFKIPHNANNKKQLYPSIDETLMGTNGGNENKKQQQSNRQTEPKTPLGLNTAETPMVNNTSTKKSKGTVLPSPASSDRFDPVYVAQNATEKENPGKETSYFSPSSLDDDRSLGQTVASSTYGDDRVKVVNKKLLDPYGDKGTYTGVVLRNTGMPHGLGRMVYEEDRRVFEGDWRHGRWHGYGRATFSNGDSYEGEYKFDQRHGTGVYRWNDGRVYDGHFSEDKRHGKGVFTWPDGAVYDGDFVNGQRQGHGKYTFADGGQYEGSWKDGRYDGFGTCTWEDGRRYRGEWRNGMAHGRGTETYPNGNIRHEGEWVDDEPVR